MEKLHWTWKKIVSIVLGFLGIGTLTSCYGMPYIDDPYVEYGSPHNKYFISGTVVEGKNGEKEYKPLENIEITVKETAWVDDENYIGSRTTSYSDGDFYVTIQVSPVYGNLEDNPESNNFTATFTDNRDVPEEEKKATRTITFSFTEDEKLDYTSGKWCHAMYEKDLGVINLDNEDSQDKNQPDEE